jgi:nitronate monooxygenase
VVAAAEAAIFAEAAARGDAGTVGVTAGEAIGLVHDVAPAGEILRRMSAEAEEILRNASSWISKSDA